jgi:ABC-type multidrug transport system permease subunit
MNELIYYLDLINNFFLLLLVNVKKKKKKIKINRKRSK